MYGLVTHNERQKKSEEEKKTKMLLNIFNQELAKIRMLRNNR